MLMKVIIATALLFYVLGVESHVSLYYEPAKLSIRNAKTSTGNGTFTTNGNGCGGASSTICFLSLIDFRIRAKRGQQRYGRTKNNS